MSLPTISKVETIARTKLFNFFSALPKKSVDSHQQIYHTLDMISMGAGALSSKHAYHPS